VIGELDEGRAPVQVFEGIERRLQTLALFVQLDHALGQVGQEVVDDVGVRVA